MPMTTRSTSASAASALRSGVSPRRTAPRPRSSARSASALPDSDVAIASGRLNARKSVSGSGRRTRNGRTTRRVSACASVGAAPLCTPRTARSSSAIASADARPFVGPLGQGPADHAVHRGHRGRAGQRRRLLVPRGVQHFDDGAAAERRASREHLEEDRAGGEEIAARVDRVADRLLGRHVARRAHHHARCASARSAGLSDPSSSGRASPKSSSFTPCGVRKTLDGFRSRWTIPRACSAESAASMPSAIGTASAGAQRSPSQPLGERLAFEELHRDEQPAAVLADLVDLADVRMIDARRGARLAPQPLPRRLVAGERRHRLEGDGALEPLVARRVDDAHAAFAQLAHDRVAADASRQDRSSGSARNVRSGCGDAAPVSHS